MTKEKLNSLPLNPKLVSQILIVLVILLSLMAGYYMTRFQELQRQYNRLNIRYLELQRN